MKKRLRFYVLWSFLLIVLAVAATVGAAWHWMHRPIPLSADRIDFVVDPGSSPRTVARALNAAGVPVWEPGFVWMARLTEQDKLIKAGGYQAINGDTPWLLLERMARGDMTQRQITFLEGWTFRQIRQALRENPDVKQTLGDISDEALMERLGSDIKRSGRPVLPRHLHLHAGQLRLRPAAPRLPGRPAHPGRHLGQAPGRPAAVHAL